MLDYILTQAFESSERFEPKWGSEVSRLNEPILYEVGLRCPRDETPSAFPAIMKAIGQKALEKQVSPS